MKKDKKTIPPALPSGIMDNHLPVKKVSHEGSFCNQYQFYCLKRISINSVRSCNALAWLNTQKETPFFTKEGLAVSIGVTPYQARKTLYELKERGAVDYKYLPDMKCYKLISVYPVDVENYCPFEFKDSCEKCPLNCKNQTPERMEAQDEV